MNALEIRLILYGLLSVGIITGTAYATHKLDSAHYESLLAAFSQYQAKVFEDNATAQKAARDALQAQIDAHTSAESNNAKVIASLQSQVDGAQRDAEFARKLLAVAANAGAAAGSGSVSKAGSGPGAPGTTGTSGGGSLAQDLGDAAGECRDAIQRLAALQAELIPQL
ncbi:MAG: hypothetical protein JWO52_4026 [Gammaproteobacteria bacterium]|nr:hypothetical protein [Gammaproteobacteria bacterium]